MAGRRSGRRGGGGNGGGSQRGGTHARCTGCRSSLTSREQPQLAKVAAKALVRSLDFTLASVWLEAAAGSYEFVFHELKTASAARSGRLLLSPAHAGPAASEAKSLGVPNRGLAACMPSAVDPQCLKRRHGAWGRRQSTFASGAIQRWPCSCQMSCCSTQRTLAVH